MERLECDRMFVAVMELGSFAAAARRIGTSNGQASKLISRLEQDLGVQLFKRSTRALSPTDMARSYYERVRLLLDEYDALDAAMRNTATSPSGRLRISAPVTFGSVRLTNHLVEFAHRYPHIELDVSFADRVVNLVDEGFDLGLRIGKLDDSRLIARKLCRIRVVTVASPAYLKAHGTPDHWRDLAEHDCILDTNFRDPRRWWFMENGEAQPLAMHGRLKFSNTEVCLQMAKAGLGVARVPTFVAGEALHAGEVIPILRAFDMAPLDLYAVYPPARQLAQKARVMIDFLLEAFAGEPTWDQGW